MTNMAGKIRTDYQAFIKDDLDDLDSDVRLAKKHLEPEKTHETEWPTWAMINKPIWRMIY